MRRPPQEGVPVIVHRSELPDSQGGSRVRVTLAIGETRSFDPAAGLDADTSAKIFRRTGSVVRVEVALGP